MSDLTKDDFSSALASVVAHRLAADGGIANLKRLSGGASQETWSFDAIAAGKPIELILRRAPGGIAAQKRDTAAGLQTEAELIKLAEKEDVPVPPVRHILTAQDGLGDGFIMGRVHGETIARKILRDAEFDEVRPHLARQCGRILAKIHRVDKAALPDLRLSDAHSEIKQYWDVYKSYDHPHPVFELAFKWLRDRAPAADRITLVHGDFRNGNLMIAPDGVRAVLDWELAHLGDPMEDLGWICVNSWRFGNIDKPVGGFGEREEMFAGYEEESGLKVDPERVKFWETLGTLKWGVMCMTMVSAFKTGMDRSVERAAIGRRSSETEIDLLDLLAPRT